MRLWDKVAPVTGGGCGIGLVYCPRPVADGTKGCQPGLHADISEIHPGVVSGEVRLYLVSVFLMDYNHIRPHNARGHRPPAPEAILVKITT
ncbi:hypothetical protein ACFLWU_01420 [Chloroflexota bacterium]